MQSDVKSPKHGSREISGFRGLRTSALDTRSLPDGWLSQALNVVFDSEGNARPKDGSEAWWPQISQRTYLAEMEPAENSTWTNGAASSVHAFGAQSRHISAAGATTMTRALGTVLDVLVGGEYTAALANLTFYARAAAPSDVAACTIAVTSGAFASNTRTWNVLTAMNALTANEWAPITVALSAGTDAGGAPDFANINGVRIVLTLTAGSDVYFDEIFVSYTDYTKSFCLGAIEYRRSTDSKRYTVAGFGESVYADLNEAQTPYKILSQQTRNLPLRFDIAEDRLVMVNGVDYGRVFDGDTVRLLGFAKPSAWTPAFAYSAATGSLVPGDVYYYGVTFVYGTSAADKHGQSTMFESPTAATVPAANTRIDLSNIPVGGVGAGVIARRIYRCRANAGPLASKYFVAEIADNTTTTYQDGAADSTILAGDVGPLNNGVPPISRAAVWFQKGMVYMTKKTIHWSRPGVNLDESFEIVPAENILLMGSAGELVGAVEFNGNLYVFARAGIAKLQWSGGVLTQVPVQRTSEQRAGNIGAIDDRAITVVQDRYIRFMDTFGQIWKMLPNEEILPESSVVKNVLDDVNNLPSAASLDYSSVDSLAQWQSAGGLDAASNLSVTDEEGALIYKKESLPETTMSAGTVTVPYSTVTDQEGTMLSANVAEGYWSRMLNSNADEISFFAGGPPHTAIRVDAVSVYVVAQGPWAGQSIALQLFAHKMAYEAGNTRGASISASNTVVIEPELADVLSSRVFRVDFTFASPVYVPNSEACFLTLKASGSFPTDGYLGLRGGTQPADLYTGGIYHTDQEEWEATTYANFQPMLRWSGRRYNPDGWVYLDAHDAGATLQRFHQFAAVSAQLRSYGELMVQAQYSTDGTLWTPGADVNSGQVLYRRQFIIPDTGSLEPVHSEFYGFPLPPDYRVGQPFPSGAHYRWVRLVIRFLNTYVVPRPLTEALSRVSTTYADALPQVVSPELNKSTEASFSTYDPEDYARDIWTSTIVSTAGIRQFGKLYADYTENQQDISFQVRTATSELGIAAATWTPVAANTFIGSLGVVAGATHFQYRIIFQDNPSKQEGTQSAVYEVRWSWAVAGSETSPMTPPVLYHYKDYTFVSWPSRGSRINDLSMAVDDYTLAYENEDGHRWSQFRAPHYACYCIVGTKLIGGTASGGRLLRLRNSAVTEYDGRKVLASLRTVPLNLGSMFLKTLHWIYFGLVLNVHRQGEFLADLRRWPDYMQSGWTFDWFVDGNTVPAITPGGIPSPAYLQSLGQATGRQGYMGLRSHAPTKNQLDLFPNTKPYQAEYGFDLGLQERAFTFQANWSPKVEDATGAAVFPTLTNIGMEFYIENYRGV